MAFDTAYGDVCDMMGHIRLGRDFKRQRRLGLGRCDVDHGNRLQFYESTDIVCTYVRRIAFSADARAWASAGDQDGQDEVDTRQG